MFGGSEYNLALTDVVLEQKLRAIRLEKYELRALGDADLQLEDQSLFATISVGELYEGKYFKLVASLFNLPRPS
jgi:hypothetical protein